jgi:molybdopterin-binding protein
LVGGLEREEERTMKLSTRNRLPGTITEIVKGEAAAKVTLRVGDNHMVALITRESVDELSLEVGREVTALVKATDVMLITDEGGIA